MPTEEEMSAQLGLAEDHVTQGLAQWPSMTFEEGVAAALRWALGEDIPPMEEEE